MTRAATILLAAAATACNIVSDGAIHLPAVESYDLWVGADTDADFQAALAAAASQWTASTGVAIALHTGEHVCDVEGCFYVFEPAEATLDALTFEQGYIGYTVPGLTTVGGGLSEAETRETMLHEVGHALGLSHHTGVAAVMEPSFSEATDHITCDDVAQFFAVRGRSVPTTGIAACSS